MLINAILDGAFPPGSSLPGERTLAAQLGVTRPTLREAIQRLARDGWLTVQHGKPTQINDIWHNGGLNVLSSLVKYGEKLPPNFVTNLLDLRAQLAPAYTTSAIALAPDTLLTFLQTAVTLPDTPEAYAQYDWQLHRLLTLNGNNPIYVLILNGFADFYEQLARLYFANPTARAASQTYYAQLATATAAQDLATAHTITEQTMLQSIALWQQSQTTFGGTL
jgi:GntR family negative regulator for fad regulon and positive regulator of fabA